MTSFRRMYLASSLALLLLAIPFIVGAEGNDAHRMFIAEEGMPRSGDVAEQETAQLDELETIAGHQYLDAETIRFLEANLWLPEPAAQYAMVGGLEYVGYCQGEGLIDPNNRAVFIESVGSISLYCSPTARFAAEDSDAPPPIVDGRVERTGNY